MTKAELKEIIINLIQNSKHKLAYFTPIPSAKGIKEAISFHEELDGGVEEIITLEWPDTITLAELTQGLTSVRKHNNAYTYPISELGL